MNSYEKLVLLGIGVLVIAQITQTVGFRRAGKQIEELGVKIDSVG